MGDFWTFSGLDGAQPALIVPGSTTITYDALSRAADEWRDRLGAAAGPHVPLVAIEFATNPDAIAAYLGVLRAGLPLLIVEPGKLGSDSQLADVWKPDLELRAEPDGSTSLRERAGWREAAAECPPPHPEVRILLSTSGSTGEPKLVRLSGRNITANAESIAAYLGIRRSDRAATTLPLFYSYGMSVLNSYLSVGAALVLTSQSITAPEFWEDARAAGVTSLAFVPHQFDLLRSAHFDGTQLPSLRYMTQAGGKLDPEAVRHFWGLGHARGWQLFVMYGQTEASPRISYVPPDALPDAADTVGLAVPGGRLWLSGEDGREIREPGQPGELVYEGPNVMMGYALTRADLAGAADCSELRTGDIAELTPNGYFRIVGRLKRFVKLYGLRLSLDQIELSLRGHGVAARVVAVDDRLVILHRDAGDGDTARTAVADSYGLPPAEIYVDHLAEVPLLPSGKPDDRALKRIATSVVERSIEADRAATVAASFADIMRWATRRAEVTPADSFVSLGGDSLSYLQVQVVLDERLGGAPSGWERMSIEELDALSLAQAPSPSTERTRVSVGVDVLLRLAAISLIVMQHATDYSIFGGNWTLIAVMGFSAARFQLQQIAAGRPLRLLGRMLYPIIPLYYVLLLFYELFQGDVPLRYWMLVGNYEPWTGGSLLVVYWFVSVYAQIVVVLALVAAIRPVRSVLARAPWTTSSVGLAVLLGVLAVLAAVENGGGDGLPYVPQRGLPECLSVFVVGWMIQSRSGLKQLLATVAGAAAVLTLLMQLDMTPKVLVVVCIALGLLALNVPVRMPRYGARRLNQLASMTLYVYLAHQFVIHFLNRYDLPQLAVAVVALLVSFAAAGVAKRAVDAVDGARIGYRSRRPSGVTPRGAVL